MKKKLVLCLLVCAMVLSCTGVLAAGTLSNAQSSNTDVTITADGANGVTVTYNNAEDGQQYLVLAVSAAGKKADGSLNTDRAADGTLPVAQNIVYMDQTAGEGGKASFTVPFDSEKMEKGTYYFYMSGSSTDSAKLQGITEVGSFDWDAAMEAIGDASGDGVVDGRDVAMAVDNFMKGVPLTDAQKTALDVDGNGTLDGRDCAKLVDHFMKGVPLN